MTKSRSAQSWRNPANLRTYPALGVCWGWHWGGSKTGSTKKGCSRIAGSIARAREACSYATRAFISCGVQFPPLSAAPSSLKAAATHWGFTGELLGGQTGVQRLPLIRQPASSRHRTLHRGEDVRSTVVPPRTATGPLVRCCRGAAGQCSRRCRRPIRNEQ